MLVYHFTSYQLDLIRTIGVILSGIGAVIGGISALYARRAARLSKQAVDSSSTAAQQTSTTTWVNGELKTKTSAETAEESLRKSVDIQNLMALMLDEMVKQRGPGRRRADTESIDLHMHVNIPEYTTRRQFRQQPFEVEAEKKHNHE